MNAALLGLMLMVVPTEVVEIVRYRMPEGRPVTIEGVRFQAFSFVEYKELLQIDQDLKAAVQDVNVLEGLITAEKTISQGFMAQVDAYKATVSLQKSELQRLFVKWEKTDDALQKAKAGSIWPKLSLLGGGAMATLGAISLIVSRL